MRNVTLIVLLSADSVSITCSLLTLWTIYRVNRWNGYTKLIFHLAFAQLLYDLSTLLVPVPGSLSYSIYVGYRSIFGLITTLLTNIIAVTVSYTVAKFHAFEVSKYLSTLIPVIYLPSITLGILIGVHVESELLVIFAGFYFWIRVLSISFNILSYIYVTIILSSSKSSSSSLTNLTTRTTTTNNIHATYQQNIRNQQLQQLPLASGTSSSYRYDPLRAFVRRFQYYPLIQVICRCGVSWYEYVYGYSYNYHSSDSLLQQILIFFYVLFLPSLGTFYFLIFISVSPNASRVLYKDFHSFLYLFTCGLYRGREGPSHSNDQSGTSRGGGSVSGLIEGFGRMSRGGGEDEGEVEGRRSSRSTMMSLYRHFLERMSSVERPDTDSGGGGMSTPLQRFSVPRSRTSRLVSIDPSIAEEISMTGTGAGAGYDYCDEEELTKEIQRVYEGTGARMGISVSPPQEISMSLSSSSPPDSLR
jgi:hypothetical protein